MTTIPYGNTIVNMKMARYIINGSPLGDTIRDNAHKYLDSLPRDRRFVITIEPERKARTLAQNRASFGPAYKILMDHIGLSGAKEKEGLHRHMCALYWGTKPSQMPGIETPVRTTTTNEDGERDVISIDEFRAFYDFIRLQAAEVGAYIPDPDPLWNEYMGD